MSCYKCDYRAAINEIIYRSKNVLHADVDSIIAGATYNVEELKRLFISVAELKALLQQIRDKQDGLASADAKYRAAVNAAYREQYPDDYKE